MIYDYGDCCRNSEFFAMGSETGGFWIRIRQVIGNTVVGAVYSSGIPGVVGAKSTARLMQSRRDSEGAERKQVRQDRRVINQVVKERTASHGSLRPRVERLTDYTRRFLKS